MSSRDGSGGGGQSAEAGFEGWNDLVEELRTAADGPIAPAPPVAPQTRTISSTNTSAVAGAVSRPTAATAVTRPVAPQGAPPSAPSVPMAELPPGARIGQYEIIRLLGAGGMGTVYLARDLRLGRRVAIKLLQSKDASTTGRFILEAQATASCSHENIVIIYEVGEHALSPFMVLEYLQGQPLSRMLDATPKLSPARAIELVTPVVRALVCAHEQGIVHRDLKPDNVFVTDSGTVKVLDFGIAKMLQGNEVPQQRNVTRQGAVIGTVKYMSPEQWGIGVEIDHRTDIWSVGVMLFEMLSGRHPMPDGMAPVMTALVQHPMLKLRDVAPEVPVKVADVVDRCLMKDRSQRFPDARALLRALEPFQASYFTGEIKGDISPYAGLSAFQESDAGRFFGRAREIAAMVVRVRDRPLLGVIGPSGIGKSSLVRAGLVPALKKSGEAWEIHALRPGRNPLQSLAGLIASLQPDTGQAQGAITGEMDDPAALADRLRAEFGLLGTVLRRHARSRGKHVLLFVDQFEELYTLVPDVEERRAFTACLSGVADDATSPVRVIVSARSDFLDRVSEDRRFMDELSQGLFFVSAPDREGLRDALVQPSELVGYRFESPAIVEDMLRHLASTASALPLLQFAASKLWEARDPSRRQLTVAAYEALGGVAGALASHADAVLAQLGSQARTLARAVLLRLVTSERTRAIVTIDELEELSPDAGEVGRLIDLLVTARLLVVQTGDGGAGATVEIVHESLIHGWPTLHRWLDETQEDSAFLEQLRSAAKQWQQKGRDPDLLWRGEMVEEATRFARRYRGQLGAAQSEFLKSVFALDARASRRKRQLAVGGGVAVALLLVAAVVALVIIRDAQKKAEAAAVIARKAEQEAKENLAVVQAKELARQKAEEARRAAEAETKTAQTQVVISNEALARKNLELEAALANAEKLRQKAESAMRAAERSAGDARKAQALALAAQKRAEDLLKREKDRVRRLEQQLGAMIHELK